jgi:Ca2+-binding RTX toxin-like protein
MLCKTRAIEERGALMDLRRTHRRSSKLRRLATLLTVAVLGAGLGVTGGANTASAVGTGGAFADGLIAESTIVNCISIIQGFPYLENGAGAYVGAWANPQTPEPVVGDSFYVHVVVYGLGNSCSGQRFVPAFSLPAGVQLNTALPILCSTKYGTSQSPSNDCPSPSTNLVPSSYGGSLMYLSSDTANARTWPLPAGAFWEFRFPVKATGVVTGGNMYGFVKMFDGNDSPVLPMRAPVYVFNKANPVPPTPPPVTISYDQPSTVKSLTFLSPFPANATAWGYFSTAVVNTWGRTGVWSMDIGVSATPYDLSLGNNAITTADTGWFIATDWGEFQMDDPSLKGETVHWRAKFLPTGGNPANVNDWIYGADQTFVVPDATATCDGKAITVDIGLGQQPTTGNDVILGTPGNDVLTGGAGNDTICGNGGDDTFIGGAGSDALIGGMGEDTLVYSDNPVASVNVDLNAQTSSGDAKIFGIDNVIGTSGNDTLTGNALSNTLVGGPGNDTILGNGADDGLSGGPGNDTLNGGDGVDTVGYGGTVAVKVSLATTAAQNTVGAGTDTISNVENLVGSNGNDTLTGSNGINRVDGGEGNDTVAGLGGNDTLKGGVGVDTVTYAGNAAVKVNLATTTPQNTVGAGVDTLSGFENLTGSSKNDTLTGTGGANVIIGGAGSDVMNGAGGIDTVSYAGGPAVKVNLGVTAAQNTVGSGGDKLSGFENLIGSSGSDTLTGSSAANTIDGGSGNDTIRGAAGNDTLIGGLGTDTASYAGTVAVKVTLGTTAVQNTLGAGKDKLSGFENLIGSSKGDTLTGNGLKNRIDGGAGNDKLNGAAGVDTCIGGAGIDTATACEVKSGIP